MHFVEVYNQFNQLQTNNILKTTTSTNLQTIEPTEVSNQQSSSYLAVITRTIKQMAGVFLFKRVIFYCIYVPENQSTNIIQYFTYFEL